MTKPTARRSTRGRIVEAADVLFYQRGYERTSFFDIAAKAQVSSGNIYYYFKTKDEVLGAVIATRAERTQAELKSWSRGATTPIERLRWFAQALVLSRADIQRYGCPTGTLCAELTKAQHPIAREACQLVAQYREWLRAQFDALGPRDDADSLALHLLARSQGVAALAPVLRDEDFVRREVDQMVAWLASLASCAQGAQSPSPGRMT